MKRSRHPFRVFAAGLLLILLAAACGTQGQPAATGSTPTSGTAFTPILPLTPQPTATGAQVPGNPPTRVAADSTPPVSLSGNAANGAVLYKEKCGGCHGPNGEGGLMPGAPQISGRGLSYRTVENKVRTSQGRMPRFTKEQLSDEGLVDIFTWLNR